MAIKKSQLYNTLWEACNALRGGMDASQYKDYVLVVLFLKYISDKAKSDPNTLISVPKGCSFYDVAEHINQKTVNEKMNSSLEKIAEENGLEGVINTVDFADEQKLGKSDEMIRTVSQLLERVITRGGDCRLEFQIAVFHFDELAAGRLGVFANDDFVVIGGDCVFGLDADGSACGKCRGCKC